MLTESCAQCDSTTIALSGGLDSTIIAHMLKKKTPLGIAIIAKDFVATDMTYCQMAAKEIPVKLRIYNVDTTEILTAVEETVKILKNFNDIEIRNNIVSYLALKFVKDSGERKIITGDGADELFAGYNFLLNKTGEELDNEIQRVCKIMHFPSKKIGDSIGVRVETPFLGKKIIEFAKHIPSDFKVRKEGNETYGKWILRKAFENNIPQQIVWRRKSPMQDGSGTAGLTEFFNAIISDDIFEEKKKNMQNSDGITIRTKESMYYYEKFRKFYNIPTSKTERTCPFCNNDIMDSKFCRMCGAYPI